MAVVITEQDFDIASEYAAIRVAAPQAGAIVFFVGLVRDLYDSEDHTASVDYIELQHFPGMTEKLCNDICQQAKTKFDVESVRIVHRVGRLHAGDQIVFVAAAALHRANAFDAAQFSMDYLKTQATLWKKEVGSRGEHWVGMKKTDKQAAERWLA